MNSKLFALLLLAAPVYAGKTPAPAAVADKVSDMEMAKAQIASLRAQVASLLKENAQMRLTLATTQEEQTKKEAQETNGGILKAHNIAEGDQVKDDGTIVRKTVEPKKK